MGHATAGAPAGAGSGDKPLVLIVDDNPDTVTICSRTLANGGYRTATAMSAEEALAAFDVAVPDLVVLDLAMPGTDGFHVARAIRARPDTAHVQILVFTGLAGDAEERARKAGATGFCLKPMEPKRLLVEVRRLCPTVREEVR